MAKRPTCVWMALPSVNTGGTSTRADFASTTAAFFPGSVTDAATSKVEYSNWRFASSGASVRSTDQKKENVATPSFAAWSVGIPERDRPSSTRCLLDGCMREEPCSKTDRPTVQ